MSVGIVCPKCGVASMFHRDSVAECPRCHTSFPNELRASAEANLARQAHPRPFLLTLGMYGSGAFGALISIAIVLAPFDIGTYSINGTTVSGLEFLRGAGVIFALVGVICVAVSYGLATERAWARPLMLLYWAVLGAYLIGDAIGRKANEDLLEAVLFLAMTLPAAGAYLYGRRNVIEYYRALQKEKGAEVGAPQASV